MARNVSDPEEIEKQDRKRAAKDQDLKTDLTMILQKPEGRRFIGYLLEKFNPLVETFNLNGSQMSYNEGRREAGREIYRMIQLVSLDTANQILHSFDKKEKEDG